MSILKGKVLSHLSDIMAQEMRQSQYSCLIFVRNKERSRIGRKFQTRLFRQIYFGTFKVQIPPSLENVISIDGP